MLKIFQRCIIIYVSTQFQQLQKLIYVIFLLIYCKQMFNSHGSKNTVDWTYNSKFVDISMLNQ